MARLKQRKLFTVLMVSSMVLGLNWLGSPAQAESMAEFKFFVKHTSGNYELEPHLPRNFSCTNDDVEEGVHEHQYLCQISFVTFVKPLSGPMMTSSYQVITGEILDESGNNVGDWVTTWKPSSINAFGWRQWRTSTATFSLKESGPIFLNAKDSFTPGFIGAETVKTSQVNIQILPNEVLLTNFLANRSAFEADYASKRMSLVCTKGKIKRTITGDPPVCPRGFGPDVSIQSPVKAFNVCKLYKKGSDRTSAKLSSGSKILTLELLPYGYDRSSFLPKDYSGSLFTRLPSYLSPWDVSLSDMNCVLKSIGASSRDMEMFREPCSAAGQGNKWINKFPVKYVCDPKKGLKIVVG